MATKRSTGKPTVLLDWFNVTYRSLLTASLTALIILGAGAYYAYIKLIYEGSPKAEARLAINLAEEALEHAGPVIQQDSTRQIKETAQRLLADARRQYDASNYEDARKAAVESKLNSDKAASLARGESAREVQLYRIEGDVKVKRVRELIWVDAERGMALDAGDQVKTSSRASAQIIYFNGTITTIKPGSLLEIKDLYDNPATRVQQVRERLREGRITASTQEPGAAGSYHEVATQNTVAKSAQRTDLEVSYDKDSQQTEVQVHAGQATLEAGGAPAVTVGAAEKVDVDRQNHVSAIAKLPQAPALTSPPDQKTYLLRDAQNHTVDLIWDPPEGAVGYKLQISSQALFASPLVDEKLETPAASLPDAREGGYYWRVAAVYADGRVSPFSEPRKFKVVAAHLGQGEDTAPPSLSIDDFLVFASQVIVRGKTEPGALLTVGGNKVDVADDGSFTTVVALKREGMNKIEFVAQDLAGNESRLEKIAAVDSY
ncbi:MAG TPA: FecR domain-containing protein [Candidatus Polarisedimenticolia bacterium]|nr:FecR domain-containing protein [Candidatus Polarisedimenticolia bacterium]